MTLRIVLAEDNYLVREGVKRLLETTDEVDLVAVCEDYDSTVKALEVEKPDVLVTDIRMPPTGTDEGIKVAERFREMNADGGVVVLSQFAEPGYALALFEKGSQGRAYLLKERVSDLDQLIHAIESVANGGSVIDPKIVEVLVAAKSNQVASPLAHLTPREREILSEMATGKNNAAIAATLFLTERAVEKHINSIFSKLALSEEKDAHKRVKAVLLFLSESNG